MSNLHNLQFALDLMYKVGSGCAAQSRLHLYVWNQTGPKVAMTLQLLSIFLLGQEGAGKQARLPVVCSWWIGHT